MDIHQFPIAFTAIIPTGPDCLKAADAPGEKPSDEKIGFVPHHEIWDLGLIVARPDNFEIMEVFSAAVRIDRPKIVSEIMMRMRGPIDPETLETQAEDPVEVLNDYFTRVKNDYVFAAFRVELDLHFLQVYAELYGIRPSWWPHKLDVYSYALGFLNAVGKKEISPDPFRVAKTLGLPVPPVPYRAMDHARLTYEIFKKLRTMKVKK